MEDAHLFEQDDCDAATLPLADFRPKTEQERFDVLPDYVRAGWVREDCFQCLLVGALHPSMVPKYSTECHGGFFLMPNDAVEKMILILLRSGSDCKGADDGAL